MSTLIKGSPHVTSTHPTTGETDQVPQYSPRRLAVYASRPSSPMIPQHSLPGGRYPLPVPPAGSRQLRLAHTNNPRFQAPPLPPGVRHGSLCSGREVRMAVTIVLEEEPYRLITDGDEHYAVIEARDGRVYSLHSHDRQEAPDTAEGMAAVVGDGWREQSVAMKRFRYMTRCEARYSELIW